MNATISGPLEWSDEILQEIFRHTPVGVVLADLHGTIFNVNDALCSMIGYPRELIVGRPATSFLFPEDWDGAAELVGDLREQSAASRRKVHKIQARSGRVVWVNTTISQVVSSKNEAICLIGFIEDVGHQLATEKALRESETLYRQVVESQSEMIVRTDANLVRIFANPAYAKFFGLGDDDVIQASALPSIHEPDRDSVLAALKLMTPEDPIRTLTFRVIAGDGSIRWTEWTSHATFDRDGALIVIQWIGRDVTERVASSEALQASEARYRRIFEDLPGPAWESDWSALVTFIRGRGIESTEALLRAAADNPDAVTEGLRRLRALSLNSAALQLAGVNDVAGFSQWLLHAYPTSSLMSLLKAVGSVVFDGTMTAKTEVMMRRSNDEMRDVVFHWARVPLPGSEWRIINTLTDVTERKQIERELIARKQRLEQAEAIAHMGNWQLDLTDGTITASPAFWRILDPNDDGPERRPLVDVLTVVHPDDAAKIAALMVSGEETGLRIIENECRIIRADGLVRAIEFHAIVDPVPENTVPVPHGIIHDVTEQRLADDALRNSEEMYRALFDRLPVAAWEADWSVPVARWKAAGIHTGDELMARRGIEGLQQDGLDSKILVVNSHALSFVVGSSGSPADFGRMRWTALNPEDTNKAMHALGSVLLGEKTAVQVDVAGATPDGRSFDIQMTSVGNPAFPGRLTNILVDVTALKKTERQLSQSRDLLEQAQALAHIGSWEWQRDDVDRLVGSVELWRVLGVVAPDGDATSLRDIWRRLDAKDLRSITTFVTELRGSYAEPFEWESEFRIRHLDGSEHVLAGKAVFRFAADGAIDSAYGTVQDITDRKLAEDALRRSESLFRLLFHNMPVAVWETDWSPALQRWQKERIETVEEAVTWLRGGNRTREELRGLRHLIQANQNALNLVAAKDLHEFHEWTATAIRREDIARAVPVMISVILGKQARANIEARVERCDGVLIDIELQLAAHEGFPGRVISAAIDVTAKKRSERELLHSQLLLEHAQAIAHTGSWEFSIEHDEIFGSREYWSIFDGHDGGPSRRALSTTLQERVHPDDRAHLWRVISQAHEEFVHEGANRGEVTAEYRVVRPDGSIHMVRGQGLYTRTADGDVRASGIIQDITDQLKAEEAAQRQREELMRADRLISLGILVSGVAHEINNPNHLIMLNAPMLRAAWDDVAPMIDEYASSRGDMRIGNLPWSEMRTEIPDIIREIEGGAERIRAIVSELREFAREQRVGELKPQPVNEIVRGSLRLLANHIKKATKNFRLELANDLPFVDANTQRLEQVIVNLVINSCQALQTQDAAVTVTTALDRDNDRVEIRVVDEGIGIKPDDLKMIREPFFTTKRTEGGMGLGLAVSDRIVQEHNGFLTFESQPGRGTTAIVSLPVSSRN